MQVSAVVDRANHAAELGAHPLGAARIRRGWQFRSQRPIAGCDPAERKSAVVGDHRPVFVEPGRSVQRVTFRGRWACDHSHALRAGPLVHGQPAGDRRATAQDHVRVAAGVGDERWAGTRRMVGMARLQREGRRPGRDHQLAAFVGLAETNPVVGHCGPLRADVRQVLVVADVHPHGGAFDRALFGVEHVHRQRADRQHAHQQVGLARRSERDRRGEAMSGGDHDQRARAQPAVDAGFDLSRLLGCRQRTVDRAEQAALLVAAHFGAGDRTAAVVEQPDPQRHRLRHDHRMAMHRNFEPRSTIGVGEQGHGRQVA